MQYCESQMLCVVVDCKENGFTAPASPSIGDQEGLVSACSLGSQNTMYSLMLIHSPGHHQVQLVHEASILHS